MDPAVEEKSVKSNAVVKYSAAQSPATFARLKCNTDLKLPPSNWLSSSADSYGLQHVLSHSSSGFSSFRMAHMFPDCVGEVDVVSDAENIKNLLKIPYSNGQVSMLVHRIENTLLIDDFDIYKHLMRTAKSEWDWVRKFFYENVRKSLTDQDKNVYLKSKSRCALQQKSLVSKFLYHSLVASEEAKEAEAKAGLGAAKPSPQPLLPEPDLEEGLPDPSADHQFNRNVVWTFEDIQMLVGTDMPIFGGSTHPCISLRLRDASSPISVLTGIDYWLDNLMSNVPEVVMCFHLNGIVQKYELIKTEDLPYMENSKFSPKVIRDIAQNILSFLKTNATKAGHTYWLFKGKDDDVVKLYDLTSLCADVDVTNGQNPFTIPVAMLLYRVARNMNNTPEGKQRQAGTIRMLLKNCIHLLPKSKYPQIVTSSHYMIADLYIPADTDPNGPGLEDKEAEYRYDEDDEEDEAEDEDGGCAVATKQLRLGPDGGGVEINELNYNYKPPPPVSGTILERAEQALSHILAGLDCLQYFPTNTEDEKQKKRQEEENPTMARPFEAIPMPYTQQPAEADKKEKKSRRRKKDKPASSAVSAASDKQALLPKTPEVWKEPDRNDNESWKLHLCRLLLEKLGLTYAILVEQYYAAKQYGSCLLHIRQLRRCQGGRGGRMAVKASCLLARAGDACLMAAKQWSSVDEYRQQMSQGDAKVAQALNRHCPLPGGSGEAEVVPDRLESQEQLMQASCACYEAALKHGEDRENLLRRLGNAQNELGVHYMTQASATRGESFQEVYTKAAHYLDAGIVSFEAVHDAANLALLHSNKGHLMRLCAHFYAPDGSSRREMVGKERTFYNKALASYNRALQVLANRSSHPAIWDTVTWELSTALYTIATLLQDYPAPDRKDEASAEREVIETLQKALSHCDMDTPGPRQPIYQFRVGSINRRLASLYHRHYRNSTCDENKRKSILQLSKMHYERAAKIFASLEQPVEYLTVQMERVALQEFQVQNTSSASQKIKLLQSCLDVMCACRPILVVLQDHGDDKDRDDEEVGKLVQLLEQRLQHALKMLAKLTGSQIKGKDETYKALYSSALRHAKASGDDLGEGEGKFPKVLKCLIDVLAEVEEKGVKK